MKTAASALLLVSAGLPAATTAFSLPSATAAGCSRSASSSSSPSSLAAIDPSAALLSDPELVLPALGAAVVAVGIAAAAGLNKGDASAGGSANKAAAEPVEEPKVDVSIPYDAPAVLAYAQYNNKSVDYEQFKTLYESKMVAEVKVKVQKQKMEQALKKMEGEVADMQKKIDGLFASSTAGEDEN